MKHGKFEKFIRRHTRDEIAGGIAVFATGLVVAGARHSRTLSRHYHELNTQDKPDDLSERGAAVFSFDENDPDEVNLNPHIALALLNAAYPIGVTGGYNAKELTEMFKGRATETELMGAVEELHANQFLGIGPLARGEYGFCATNHLTELVTEGTCPPIQQLQREKAQQTHFRYPIELPGHTQE